MANQLEVKFTGDAKDLKLNIDQINGKLGKLNEKADSASAGFKRLAGAAVSFAVIKAGFDKSVNSALAYDRIMRRLEVGTRDASKAFREISGIVNRYGLNLEKSAGSIASFAAATKGTTLEGTQTIAVFKGMAAAASALSLSADQTEGALKALEQMVSKGTVQAEELRGQLGERLPGAFALSAKAMKLTTSELNKMLSLGKVTAEDLLPKLAMEMENLYGSKAISAAGQLQGSLNKVNNVIFETSAAFGQALTPAIQDVSSAIQNNQAVFVSSAKAITFVTANIQDIIIALAAYKVITGAAALQTGLLEAATVAGATASKTATASFWLQDISLKKMAASTVAATTSTKGLSVAMATAGASAKKMGIGISAALGPIGWITIAAVAAYESLDFLFSQGAKDAEKLDKATAKTFNLFKTNARNLDDAIRNTIPNIENLTKKQIDSAIAAKKHAAGLDNLRKFVTASAEEQKKITASMVDYTKKLNDVQALEKRTFLLGQDKEALKSVGIEISKLANMSLADLNAEFDKFNIGVSNADAKSKAFTDRITKSRLTKIQKFTIDAKKERDNLLRFNKEGSDKLIEFDKVVSTEKRAILASDVAAAVKKAEREVEIEAQKQLRIKEFALAQKQELEDTKQTTKTARAEVEFKKASPDVDDGSLAAIDKRINAQKAFFATKTAIEDENFKLSQDRKRSDFNKELESISEHEVNKESIKAEMTSVFNEAQLLRDEEYAILKEENNLIELEKTREFEKSKEDIRNEFRQRGVDIASEFAALQEDITSGNFGALLKKTDSFMEDSEKLWDSGFKGKVAVTQAGLGIISGLMDSGNRKMFEAGKVAAIANATISTIQGATQALSLGPILGPIMAGVVTAMGVANISKIASTKFGGGAKPSAASAPSIPTPASPSLTQESTQPAQQAGSQVNLTVQALDPSAIDETAMQQIGDKLAPVLQKSFDNGQNFSVV